MRVQRATRSLGSEYDAFALCCPCAALADRGSPGIVARLEAEQKIPLAGAPGWDTSLAFVGQLVAAPVNRTLTLAERG